MLAVELGEPEQDCKKGEQAYENQDNGDCNDRRLYSLLGRAGNWRERLAPEITNAPPVLPNRDGERQNLAATEPARAQAIKDSIARLAETSILDQYS